MTTCGEVSYNRQMMRRLLPLASLLFFGLLGFTGLLGCSSSSSDTPAADAGDSGTQHFDVEVLVGSGGTVFVPATVTIKVGQTVKWTWIGSGHSVTSGDSTACTADGKFDSTIKGTGNTFFQTFATAGTVDYFCQPHCMSGMKGEVIVTP